MKYKYIGPKRSHCMAYGYDFAEGAVDVKDKHALSKLAANPEFLAVVKKKKDK